MWQNLTSKTTLAGILAAVGILFTQASFYLDDKLETKPDLTLIFAAFGLLGVGYSAADRPKPE